MDRARRPRRTRSRLSAGRSWRGDAGAARRWLMPGAAWNELVERLRERVAPRRHRLVAFAKIGQQRAGEDPARGPARRPRRSRPAGRSSRAAGARPRWIWPRRSRSTRLTQCSRSVLVANRGEIARRIIRACRALGVRAVAVYSEADAELALTCARPTRPSPSAPAPARESYLSVERILEAAAPHRRRGDPSRLRLPLRELALRQGVRGGGPRLHRPAVARDPADGRQGRRPPADGRGRGARRCRAATGRWTPSTGPAVVAARVGYPVILKAAAGGGGIGMVKVERGRRARARPSPPPQRRAAGGLRLGGALRRALPRSAAARRGAGLRRRARAGRAPARARVLDPAPTPEADRGESRRPACRRRSRHGSTAAAVTGARAVGYVNAGTMEFIVEGERFYFLEMNTRLQVEHPVTEEVTGVDLVQAQLRVAAGEPLPWRQEEHRPAGREPSSAASTPRTRPRASCLRPGRITRWCCRRVPGSASNAGSRKGCEVSVHYDPLLAKLVAAGATREEAIDRMARRPRPASWSRASRP